MMISLRIKSSTFNDHWYISKTIHCHIPIVGNLQTVFDQLQTAITVKEQKLDNTTYSDWWAQINGWRKQDCLQYDTNSSKIKPQAAIRALYKVTNGDAYISSDVGQHQMFAAQHYPFKKPRQWINSGGLGTMGFGLPAAMGVKLAFPDKESVCVTGDGSIQMNIQELSTCMQYGLPIKIVSFNNRSLGMVRQWQDMIYSGRHSCSYMESLPDFIKLAESYGHIGIKINHPDELEAKLTEAFTYKNKLVFIDICIDETEHVYPMQIRLGAIDEMWLRKGIKA